MNKSTSFQPVGSIVFSGILPRRLSAFFTVWGGQMENLLIIQSIIRYKHQKHFNQFTKSLLFRSIYLSGHILLSDSLTTIFFFTYDSVSDSVLCFKPIKFFPSFFFYFIFFFYFFYFIFSILFLLFYFSIFYVHRK